MASNTKPEGKGKLSEVEAAIRLRMSPELLEHFTRYGARLCENAVLVAG
jgi:hypothetical protein